jgi:hypothetical protein
MELYESCAWDRSKSSEPTVVSAQYVLSYLNGNKILLQYILTKEFHADMDAV